MASKVEIANQALTLIGAKAITDFDDDNKNSRAVKRIYDPLRLQLLYDHPYNFAMKRASLAALSEAPVHTYARKFELPSDCLRVIEAQTDAFKWTTEEGVIVTDASAPLAITYVADIEDPLQMTAQFRKALAYDLATNICFELTANSALMERMEIMANRQIQLARSLDAQEGIYHEPADGSWLESRL